jgi:hypothetical protein
MTAITPLIDELRSMPSDRLEITAAYIDTLLESRRAKRNAMIDATSGSLAGAIGDALEAALAEDADISPAWKAEINRRMETIRNGTAKLIPHEEVMASAHRKIAARRTAKSA